MNANMNATATRPATEKQIKYISDLIRRSEPFTPRIYKGGRHFEPAGREEALEAVRQFEEWRRYAVNAAKGLTTKLASKIIALYIEINDAIRSEGYVPRSVFDDLDLRESKLFAKCGIMTRDEYMAQQAVLSH